MRYTLERRSSSLAFGSTDLTLTVPIAICSTASMTLLAKTLPLRPHPPSWFTHLIYPVLLCVPFSTSGFCRHFIYSAILMVELLAYGSLDRCSTPGPHIKPSLMVIFMSFLFSVLSPVHLTPKDPLIMSSR